VALAKLTSNDRFAYDSYRRFIALFGKIALGVDEKLYDTVLEEMKHKRDTTLDTKLTGEDMKELCAKYLEITETATGKPFPMDPYEQLKHSVKAVFASWMGKRAVDYRREFKITPDRATGTAVTIQEMVFGNMGDDSGTGVCFTRDPATGENRFFGEYLTNAQGEDVVAGIRTPKQIVEMEKDLPESYK
jgi:pyruvate,orthophosphate dikinase